MKIVRRFCLILCALGVFLNVTLSNVLHAHAVRHTQHHAKSKYVAFSKVSDDPQFNAFEFEEDIELDEDGGDFQHDLTWAFTTYQTIDLTFKEINSNKYTYYAHRLGWSKLPLFVQFQNFRI